MPYRRRNEVRKYTEEEWAAERAKFSAKPGALGRLRQGPWQDLEDFADEMLRQSFKGIDPMTDEVVGPPVTAYSEKSDVLTPWKIVMREKREIFVASGTPDPAIRLGMYRRAANPDHPELNSRMGMARARTRGAARTLSALSTYSGQDESGENDNVLGGE